MKTPETMAAEVKLAFETIYRDSMSGLPIVNPILDVDCIGFTEHEGRVVGVIVSPWLMTLAVFPRDDEDWTAVAIGTKKSFSFPSRDYNFLANEIEDIGPYYGFALHSPMHEFEHHPHAVASAEAFMEVLMIENENAEDELDEERLALFLAGEDMETIKQKECASKNAPVDGAVTLEETAPKEMGRREFLSGGVRSSGSRASMGV